jgi:hypothetical protein
MWRSVGFLMSFSVVLEGMVLLAFIIMFIGGKQRRATGWQALSGMLFAAGAVEAAGMALVVSVVSMRLQLEARWLTLPRPICSTITSVSIFRAGTSTQALHSAPQAALS